MEFYIVTECNYYKFKPGYNKCSVCLLQEVSAKIAAEKKRLNGIEARQQSTKLKYVERVYITQIYSDFLLNIILSILLSCIT